MRKNIWIFVVLLAICPTYLYAEDDDFLFDTDEYIADSPDADITMEGVTLNPDATTVSVMDFDISGIMLDMHFEDVYNQFVNNDATYVPRAKNGIVYTINNEWKYNLDYECRQQGIVIPDKLDKCIKGLAQNRGLLYASELHLERPSTGETIVVYFTSNETDNVVYRVMYNNDVNEIEGDNPKFRNQRDKKVLAFWQSVLDKYGTPNSGEDRWISSTNSYDPQMIAYFGSLELLNNGKYATDQAQNVQHARENFHAKSYSF